jgi:hypothetical protein
MYAFLSFERFGFIILIIFLYSGLLQKVIVPPLLFFLKFFLGTDAGLGI